MYLNKGLEVFFLCFHGHNGQWLQLLLRFRNSFQDICKTLTLATVELGLQALLGALLFNRRDSDMRKQSQKRQSLCIKHPLMREVHSILKLYPLEFNRFLSQNLADIHFKLKAVAVMRKLLPYYERSVSGLSNAFFWK